MTERPPLRLRLRAWGARLAWWRAAHQVLLGPAGCWSSQSGRAGPPHRWPDWAAWCAAHPGERAQVWLDGAWLQEVSCDPSLPLPDDRAVVAYVRQLLVHYHGMQALAWPLGAWRTPQASGATALHHPVGASLVAEAQAHQVHLRGLAPWWLAVLHRQFNVGPAAAPSAWRQAAQARLLVVSGQQLTEVLLTHGLCREVSTHWLAAPTSEALQAWLEDHPNPPATRIVSPGWLDIATTPTPAQTADTGALAAQGPADLYEARPKGPATVTGPDLLQRAPAAPRMAWVALLVSAVVAGTAGWEAWAGWRELQSETSALTQLEAERDQALQLLRAATGQAGGAPLPAPAGAGAWAMATAGALQHPWSALLAGVEASALPGVAWMTLEHAATSGQVRLAGQAADRAAALGLVPLLAAQPHWNGVALRQLGGNEAVESSLRFELQAVLENPLLSGTGEVDP